MNDELRKRTRRSFLTLGAAYLAGLGGWKYLRSADGAWRPGLEWNGRLWQKLSSNDRLAPSYPRQQAGEPRINGAEGLRSEFDPASWCLQVEGRSLTLDDLRAMPRTEMTTQLKCVEGWSEIVNWAGIRLADLVTRPTQPYVAAATPDGLYYVGLTLESALHPQSLLCYEMNGHILTVEHGGPVRLVLPGLYGFKSLKRLGSLNFTATRPPDFWAERGYDWHSTL